jgi:hypothetical protein
MNSRIPLCFVLVSALAAACGGGEPEAAAPSNASLSTDAAAPSSSAAPAESAAPAASAAPVASAVAPPPAAPPGPPGPGDWANWSHEWKLAYMKSTVMPKMGDAFHTFDAKKYDEPKCVLCHGGGVADGSFKMPNPDLPKLEFTSTGKLRFDPKSKKIVEFMHKVVVPTTADLLGEPAFDMKTKTGFGCFGCHTKKEPAAAKSGAATPAKTP